MFRKVLSRRFSLHRVNSLVVVLNTIFLNLSLHVNRVVGELKLHNSADIHKT